MAPLVRKPLLVFNTPTWVVALNVTSICFGADLGSTTLENLERDRRTSLEVIAPGDLVFLIKGKTSQIKPQIEASSFKMTMMLMEVLETKDQSVSVANVHPLSYEWIPEQRDVMSAMENVIYAEMREWNN